MMGDGSSITKITIQNYTFCIEPQLVFLGGTRLNFRWLADGGIVIWKKTYPTDCDADYLRFFDSSSPIVIDLSSKLLELGLNL